MSSHADFDFFIGAWLVKHRRLRERLVNCHDWDEFNGTTRTWKTLGGMGNCDDNYLELPGAHYHAMTLRTYDPTTAKWSIWWLDGRHPGRLDVPVVGGFTSGVGTFYAPDTLNGLPIVVRFSWCLNADGTPRWEQAFSPNNGLNWETNWTMDFTRSD